MLRLLFGRYKELLTELPSDQARKGVVPDAPPAVCRAFSSDLRLDEYLLLDDHSLTEFAKACTKSDDRIMVDLASGLLHRQLYKAVDVTDTVSPNVVKFSEKAKEVIEGAGLAVVYAFAPDTPGDTAYKLYNPDAEKPATQIYIEAPNGKHQELSECSDSVKELAKPYTLVRYYFPAAVRAAIMSQAVPLLAKE